MNRIIGKFEGEERGPLLVVFGAMHGNEPSGVKAIKLLFKMLEIEPKRNPGFKFHGKFIGMVGNLAAYKKNRRFIKKDLNRSWTDDSVRRSLKVGSFLLSSEEREIKEILTILKKEVEEYQPQRMIVLDLHTTSAFGGIFTIVNDDPESLEIGSQMKVPVIKGMLKGISGTTLHFFTDKNFPVKTTAVTFEGGQHEEPQAVSRNISAIVNCMRSIGCVASGDVENIHDQLLLDYAKNLPNVTELVYTYSIQQGEGFEMLPGFRNFQRVEKGQLLAKNKTGEIRAIESGLILMPLYQKQGSDGFFIIKEVRS